MSNITNHDSQNAITSLDPKRRESRSSNEKTQDVGTSTSPGAIVPQRRAGMPHTYGTEVESAYRTQNWLQELKSHPTPRVGLSIVVAILALTAFGLATHMTVPWFTESKVVGCNGSVFNCDNVLNSRWSNWLGLPVSGLAALTYFCLLGALVMAQSGSQAKRNIMWTIVTVCSLAAGAAAIWFIYLQIFVLKHLCQYCLMAHACGIALAIIFLWARPLGTQTNTYMGILALVGLVFLSVGQAVGKEQPTFQIQEHTIQSTPAPVEGESATTESDESMIDAPLDDIFEAPDLSQIFPSRPIPNQTIPIQTRSLKNRLSLGLTYLLASLMPVVSSSAILLVQDGSAQQPSASSQQDPASESQDNKSEQSDSEKPAPPQTRRILEISGGAVKLDVKQWPIAGRTDAEYVCVEMFDYNCEHCRQTHSAVRAAKERLGDRFAVIALPLPLNTACNNQISQTGGQFVESCLHAKLAISVWKANPEKFAEFHDWMFTGPRAPSYSAARAHAESMVGKAELEKVWSSTLPDAYIQKHVQIYARLNRGNIPKLLFRTTSIVGMFQSPDQLVDILKRQGPLVETPVGK